MRIGRPAVALCWVAMTSSVCFAAGGNGNTPSNPSVIMPGAPAAWSSSADTGYTLPEAPVIATADPVPVADPGAPMSFAQAIAGATGSRPFSGLGVAVKFGLEGFGFDVATPIATKFNVRAGASFFSYTPTLTTDGITINPNIQFRKAAASLDWYPWGGGFRISPGFVFYNGNHADASALVPGGQTFDLNDQTYTSSNVDPVHGSAQINFGNKTAPSLTVGWGNIASRRGGHWTVPFEIGFEYIGRPTLVYNLAGTACNQFGCMNVATDPQIQANLKAEQNTLNDDISGLRFYPILSVGVGYRF